MTASSVRLSPLLSTHVTVIRSPAFAPFTRRNSRGLRETAWLHWASMTGLPLWVTTTLWMKCSGTTVPFASLRLPVSIGCIMMMRTSATSPCSVARILIGSDMDCLSRLSAAADGDLHLRPGDVELPVCLDDGPDVGRLAHLEIRADVAFRAVGHVEGRCQRKRILLRNDRDLLRVGYPAGDRDRDQRAVFRDVRSSDHDVAALDGVRGAEALQRV